MHKAMNEDRISGLPDAVLGHILSYVTTKESVRTSILSKRWLSVWSYVPVLDLDDSSLSSTDLNKDQAIRSSFIQFLNNVFNLHQTGSLQKLTLKCRESGRYHVHECVMAAMKLRVPHLDLCFEMVDEYFNIAVPLFAYEDLVDLRLGGFVALDIPGEVLLPCLKKLHLDYVLFSNDESCHKLLCGCPVLEYLHLNSCRTPNAKTLEIIAPELKSLVLIDDHAPDDDYYFQVVVDAPNLEVLRYDCYMVKGYSFKNLNSLVTAYIEVGLKYVHQSQLYSIRKAALQLVNGIANAKFITLTGFSLQFLSVLDPTALPVFNNCAELILGGNKYCGVLLRKFLENSPCLQKLVLDREIAYNGVFGEFIWHSPAQLPKCLLYSLESVEIRGYHGDRDVLKLVEYLVSNSEVSVLLSSGNNRG